MKIVVGASSFAGNSKEALRLLEEKGIEVVLNPFGRKMTEEEIINHLQGADGLLAGLEPLNENVLSQAKQLKAIARIGIGMDNVDKEAARKKGVKVSNTPDGPTDAVAEMTLAAFLSIVHRIIPSNDDIHKGIWKKRMGCSIQECTVLFIGYGHIGKKTAHLFEMLGAKVLIYDKYDEQASNVTLEEGLRQANAISLHASGKDVILTAELLKQVREGCIILNSARGALIDEEALYEGLSDKKIGWYWGDAHWEEPYTGKITQCENAVLTPHISTYTTSCREKMEMQAVRNILSDLLESDG